MTEASEPIPGLSGSADVLAYQRRGLRLTLGLLTVPFLVAAAGAAYLAQSGHAEAERTCAVSTYYDSPEACMATLDTESGGFFAFAGGLTAVAALLAVGWALARTLPPRFVALLRDTPHQIETIYAEEWRGRAAPADREGEVLVVLTLRGGGEVRIAVPSRARAKEVIDAIARRAPAARVEKPKRKST